MQKEKGLGPAVMEAISIIETDCVIEFSLDGNCFVEQLPMIVENLHRAEKDFTDAIALDNSHAFVHNNLGNVHYALKRYKEAITSPIIAPLQ